MTKKLIFVLAIAGLLLMAGCRVTPVHNVSDAPVSTLSGGQPTLDEMKQAITRAGVNLGWVMREQSPGMIEGRLALRDHLAVVEIPYSRSGYSIRYKDSRNLNYDGENIHKNYNGWVQRLDQSIKAQLSQY